MPYSLYVHQQVSLSKLLHNHFVSIPREQAAEDSAVLGELDFIIEGRKYRNVSFHGGKEIFFAISGRKVHNARRCFCVHEVFANYSMDQRMTFLQIQLSRNDVFEAIFVP